MPENQREKNLTYVHPFPCVTSQFNTIKLSEKSKVNKCPHCLKTFIKPSGLKAHIFSHTGEKPHKCPVPNCGRYFSLLSNLRRHMKIHNKEESKNRLAVTKRPVPKIRPLLPVGPSLANQYDGGNQSDQGYQFHSSHGIAPNYDHAYFHRESLTSVEFSSLPVTPMEADDFGLVNNSGNICDKNMTVPSSLLDDAPVTDLAAASFYLPSDGFQLPTTQESLEDYAVAHFQTPPLPFPFWPGGPENPTWSTILSNEPQLLSMEELNYLANFNNQYLPPPQQYFYPQDFFPERNFYIFK